MKPLIAPTNFTASSVNAAKYAANMAMMVNSDLYLIHVLQLPVSSAEIPLTEEMYGEMHKSGEQELENLKLLLQKQTEGRINIFTLLESGNVEQKVAELCQRKAPFAVVMGIKKSAAERFVFGSNALISISHLHYPLFVIPEDSSFHALRKMVLAYDLEGPNKNIPVSYLKELQRIFNADLDVLNINAKKREDLQSNQEYLFIKDMLQDL
ncbi:MAG TPA: universal stress protein, partial [Puia sp.]|nr:universal stress protein [Puia sp.]